MHSAKETGPCRSQGEQWRPTRHTEPVFSSDAAEPSSKPENLWMTALGKKECSLLFC